MSTIKDVARRTGLSLSTISKYLNGGNVREENRLAIDAAVAELGFSVNVFARSLKANRSMTVGVLLPTISSPFFGRVVASLELILRRSGYECFVCSYDFDREQELGKLAFLARYHVDGIVYVPEHATAEELRVRVGTIPVVLIDRSLENAQYDTVVVDNLNAVYMAVEHLIGRGHRRIGLIAGPQTISTARERTVGYRRVLAAWPCRTRWISSAMTTSTCAPSFRPSLKLSSSPWMKWDCARQSCCWRGSRATRRPQSCCASKRSFPTCKSRPEGRMK